MVASAAGYGVWNTVDALPAPTSPYVSNGESEDSSALILILRDPGAENPFGEYLGEILRAEGIPGFVTLSWDEIGAQPLDSFRVILLAEGGLNAAQAERLAAFVSQGGGLVAFRPDAHLAETLGLERLPGELDGGYMQMDAAHPLAQGLETRALQFHGVADYYRPAGVEVVAWVSGMDDRPTQFPAVTIHAFGEGRAACWCYDLARSVVLSRQGNPAWADQERDGRLGIRGVDMFVGWMDLDRLDIPQADEQMRLLSRIITDMLEEHLPLPRLGYFPAGKRGVLIATGDSHQNAPGTIEKALGLVERYDGQMSIYHTPEVMSKLRRLVQRGRAELAGVPLVGSIVANNLSYPTPDDVAGWRARGHEFGLHPYVEEGLEAGWEAYQKSFLGFGYGPISPTTRTHRILWSGWVETARVQASHGIRMNMDYYHYGTAFQKASGEWVNGFFNASGLPMKFIDEQGRLLTIYQQVTQLVDEHLMKVPWGGGWVDLTADEAVQVAEQVLQRAAAVGVAVAAQYHVDLFAFEEQYVRNATRFMEGSLSAAVELGFPIWTAESWYRFTEARQQAQMRRWSADAAAGRLEFEVETDGVPQLSLAVMLPVAWNAMRLDQVRVDGAPVAITVEKVGGLEYGWFPVSPGRLGIMAQYR